MPNAKAALDAVTTLLEVALPNICDVLGSDQIVQLDVAMAPHLKAAAQAQIDLVVQAIDADTSNSALQEAGARFLVCTGKTCRDLLMVRRVDQMLARAVRSHPRNRGVQDHAKWALLKFCGLRPLIDVLQDPELSSCVEVTRAALWSIAHSGELNADAVAAVRWPTRCELANVAEQSMARFETDAEVVAYGLGVLGSMLKAQVPDAVHEHAVAALPRVLKALQAYPEDKLVQQNAAFALANLVEGNGCAEALLQAHRSEVMALLVNAMATNSNAEVLDCLCRVLLAASGSASGLLEAAFGNRLLQSPKQQAALLQAFSRHVEECDAETLIKLDVVGNVSTTFLSNNVAASAAIAVLGKVAEFLLQHAASPFQNGVDGQAVQAAVERSVDIIVHRLQTEIAAPKPDVFVYAEALGALRNVSRRSDQLAKRISACSTLAAAVDLAFEKDYWNLQFESLWQLLGAVFFFSGLPRLQLMMDRYPEAPVFHEAACGVLVDDAEHQDGSDLPGSIMHSAVSLAVYVTKVLRKLVPGAKNGQALAVKAVELHGHVLGAVPPGTVLCEQEGPVLENGIVSLVELLQLFPASSKVASAVCCALVRIAAANATGILPVLRACKAGDTLLAVIERFAEDEAVLGDAAVALGALGGAGALLQFMSSAQHCPLAQLAACTAVAEMCRMGLSFASTEECAAVGAAIRCVQTSFATQEHWRLQAQAELALGLIGDHQRLI